MAVRIHAVPDQCACEYDSCMMIPSGTQGGIASYILHYRNAIGTMSKETSPRLGQCHCGAVRFEVTLAGGFSSVRRCACSYCRMRGAVVAMAETDGVTILQGEEMLTRYRFHTGTAEHFFCSICGIYTHHQRRSDPGRYAVNVACLDGVSPFDFKTIPVVDGVNHTSDTGQPQRLAGELRFFPAPDGTAQKA